MVSVVGWPPKLPAAGGTVHSDCSMPSFGDPVQRLCAAGDWKLIVDELWSMFGLEFISYCYVLGPSLHHFCYPSLKLVCVVGSLHL